MPSAFHFELSVTFFSDYAFAYKSFKSGWKSYDFYHCFKVYLHFKVIFKGIAVQSVLHN